MVKKKPSKLKEILTFREVLQKVHAGLACDKAGFTAESMRQTYTNSPDSRRHPFCEDWVEVSPCHRFTLLYLDFTYGGWR